MPAAELSSPALVEIRGLDVGYVRHRTAHPAVVGLDLTVRSGEIVAVVGESGSGKTTTANAVIGLLPANGRITAGSAVVDGVETAGAGESILRRLRGSAVGLVPQDPMVGLNPTTRIGAQIAEAVKLRGVRGPAVAAEVLEFLEQAGVPEPELRARQYPHELSGGLRQRVLIAIALAGRPKLIIADEPTSALDVTVEQKILDHLTGLVREQGIALLLITHDLAVAADRADRVIVMRGGRIVEQGDPRTILVRPREAYTRALIAAAPGLAHGGVVVPRFDVRGQPLPEPILTLTEIRKTFPTNDARRGQRGFNALDGVSIRVPRGQTHALVGESGCGKTTTLRVALGLEKPTSGSVVLDGIEIGGLSWGRQRPLRRRAQLVQQNPFAALDPRFTVKQSITEPLVAMKIGDRRSRHARARELLDQVALPASYLDRLPAELSGGQRQRVAIARALAPSPDLLMLDEPVSALDVLVQEQILRLLSELQTELGLSYLFVSHDLAVVAEISHTVSVMSQGRVVEEGPVAEVFTSPRSPHTRELIDAIPGQRTAARAREDTLPATAGS
ncbi:ABC transporter ATP-binding protein [Pseudofrankia sp. DC12]|uniref:dipeptide ABC transporter ATP-binding protein n=1 Tax=Pseudofrankia sp. DC12 TaxID=683315 RepID=UPI0005F77C4B|nr:ABC transporter ATP-binding protein [Pseudofrankia sp. DC12]